MGASGGAGGRRSTGRVEQGSGPGGGRGSGSGAGGRAPEKSRYRPRRLGALPRAPVLRVGACDFGRCCCPLDAAGFDDARDGCAMDRLGDEDRYGDAAGREDDGDGARAAGADERPWVEGFTVQDRELDGADAAARGDGALALGAGATLRLGCGVALRLGCGVTLRLGCEA